MTGREPRGRCLEPEGFSLAVHREKPGLFLLLSPRSHFLLNLNSKYTMSTYCVPGSGDVNTVEVLPPSHLLTMTFQGLAASLLDDPGLKVRSMLLDTDKCPRGPTPRGMYFYLLKVCVFAQQSSSRLGEQASISDFPAPACHKAEMGTKSPDPPGPQVSFHL